MNKGSKR